MWVLMVLPLTPEAGDQYLKLAFIQWHVNFMEIARPPPPVGSSPVPDPGGLSDRRLMCPGGSGRFDSRPLVVGEFHDPLEDRLSDRRAYSEIVFLDESLFLIFGLDEFLGLGPR